MANTSPAWNSCLSTCSRSHARYSAGVSLDRAATRIMSRLAWTQGRSPPAELPATRSLDHVVDRAGGEGAVPPVADLGGDRRVGGRDLVRAGRQPGDRDRGGEHLGGLEGLERLLAIEAHGVGAVGDAGDLAGRAVGGQPRELDRDA